MKIILEIPNTKVSRRIVGLLNKRLEKIGKVSDQIIEARVFLKIEKSDGNKDKLCEVRLVLPGNDLFVSDKCATFEEAIANVAEVLTRKVIDWKQKLSYVD